MKTIAKLLAISSLAVGCASTQAGRNPGADLRGDIVVHGLSVKVVTMGPADVHTYSAFAGGAIYAAPARSGGDVDCGVRGADQTTLEADHVHVLRIGPGQVACLATVKQGSFELLWHAHEQKLAPITVATAHAQAH